MESEKEYFGFINIDKPVDWSSHDVVAKLRRVLKYKKIGHAGTLDPFATGVLPIAIGSATRLIRFLSKDKAYEAELDLSFTTDTDDLTGEKLKEALTELSLEEIQSKLQQMLGNFEQYPPLYSAKKINGKKLYELMRAGEDLDLSDIKPKTVFIKKIDVIKFAFPYLKLEIECGEGTYIRSIARDIGGHLTSLRRTKSNNFDLTSSIRFEDLEDGDLAMQDLILNASSCLALPKHIFSRKEVIALQQGQRVYLDDYSGEQKNSVFQCLDQEEELIGLAELLKVGSNYQLQPKVIFA